MHYTFDNFSIYDLRVCVGDHYMTAFSATGFVSVGPNVRMGEVFGVSPGTHLVVIGKEFVQHRYESDALYFIVILQRGIFYIRDATMKTYTRTILPTSHIVK